MDDTFNLPINVVVVGAGVTAVRFLDRKGEVCRNLVRYKEGPNPFTGVQAVVHWAKDKGADLSGSAVISVPWWV